MAKQGGTGPNGIVCQMGMDFFLSATCWQDDADLKAVSSRVLPPRFVERLKEKVGIERPILTTLKRLRRGDEEYLYESDLHATISDCIAVSSTGFSMVCLHHDCLALARYSYTETLDTSLASRDFAGSGQLASLGKMYCSIDYSSPSLRHHNALTGNTPGVNKPFFLWRNPVSPRNFALFLPDHDPQDANTAALVTNYLMLLFAAHAKVLYYTTKAGREVEALSHARLHKRNDAGVTHFREVILPQIGDNATKGATLATVVSRHLDLAEDTFLKTKADECWQLISKAGGRIPWKRYGPCDAAFIHQLTGQSESRCLEFKASFMKPGGDRDQKTIEGFNKITNEENRKKALEGLENGIKREVVHAVLEFINTEGGHVVLGVEDAQKTILGLDLHYETKRVRKRAEGEDLEDCFTRFVMQEISNHVKPEARERIKRVKIDLVEIEGKTVGLLTVEPMLPGKEVYDDQGILHVRTGTGQGGKLQDEKATEHCLQRWEDWKQAQKDILTMTESEG